MSYTHLSKMSVLIFITKQEGTENEGSARWSFRIIIKINVFNVH